MNFSLPRAASVLSFGLAAPLLATAALADVPTQEASEPVAEAATEEPVEAPEGAPVEGDSPATTTPTPQVPVAAEQPEEEKIICRSIRLDMSSRRKTRVCRTEEEWRQLNQRR